ncbi:MULTISPECIES: S41 family peptidase [Chryseobacterium]|uniref:S41 family peptidase n=1 Tax=Chryseobacterium TaxID=59732 RepID=UPI0012958440|nr:MULTISPECIES: S41 family peptidase [Chryseobacterium]MDR6919171.1 C-terminal processing protease CtpA/Prc [Chryseobacterium sp. 2987]
MKKFTILFLVIIHSLVYGQKDQYHFFFKTWNFLKYYHSDIAGGKINADSLFLATVGKVNSQSDINTIIHLLSENLNHTFSKVPVSDHEKNILSVNQDFGWFQKSKKISAENRLFLNNAYSRRFIADPSQKEKTAEDKSTYSFAKDENLPLPYRLLIMAKIQGSIDYLYPHKYLMPKNSEVYFTNLVDQTVQCATRKDFEIIMARAAARMEDTHSFQFYEQLNYKNEIYHRLYYPPFDYAIFDDHILVTDLIFPEACSMANIHTGDKITEINGKTIRQIIKEKQELLSTSNTETLLYMLSDYQRNLIWPNDHQQKELRIQSKQKHKTFISNTDFINFKNKEDLAKATEYIKRKIQTKDHYKINHKDIAYFKINDVFSLTNDIPDDKLDEHMENIFKEASSKKIMVFDMRGYPDWGGFVFNYVYQYFSPIENHFGLYYKPNINNIGTYIPISYKEFGHYYNDIKNKTVHPYQGKVFLIVNPDTLSMSEWNTMNLQNIFPQAITIGQKTAGADGDIVTVPLYAGYNLVFTGNGIFYYDHTQTQKVGIKINELIRYTDDDVIQKRDLELERILKALK